MTTASMHPMQEFLKPRLELLKTLALDVSSIIGESVGSLSQTDRRSLVRALFALIEADVFNRKQIALYLHEKENVPLSITELVLLREEQYDLDDMGLPRTRPRFLRLRDNFRFAVRSYAKANDIIHELRVGTEGWQAFLNVIEIRNRITHPKDPDDLLIGEKELLQIKLTFSWFMENADQISQKMEQRHGQIE